LPTHTASELSSQTISEQPSNIPSSLFPIEFGGKVWNDVNRNGLFDSGEMGVAGILIKAYTCETNILIAMGKSTTNGSFKYIGHPGCYYLTIQQSEEYRFTSMEGGDSTVDPETGRTEDAIFHSGESDLSWNAGIVFGTWSPSKAPSVSPIATMEPTGSPIAKASESPSSTPSLLIAPPTETQITTAPSLPPVSSQPISSQPSSSLVTSPPTANSITLKSSDNPSASPVIEPSESKVSASVSPTINPQPVATTPKNPPPSTSPLSTITTTTPSSAPVAKTISPTSLVPTAGAVTKQPVSSQPTEASFWQTREPTPNPSVNPTEGSFWTNTKKPTTNPSVSPVVTETYTADFPEVRYTLLETEGELSEEAVDDATIAVSTFLNAKLSKYYNNDRDYFASLELETARAASVTRNVHSEPIRMRRLSQTSGTSLVFEGAMEFNEEAPSTSELTAVLLNIGQEYNSDLVSQITGTGNLELGNVFVVFVEDSFWSPSTESSDPSASPTKREENFMRNPDGINEVVTEPDNGTKTPLIIIIVCGVAAFTMMVFIFATRRRPRRHDGSFPTTSRHMIPVDIEASSMGSFEHSIEEEGFELNGNEAGTAVSSVTDWNDYPRIYSVDYVRAVNCIKTANNDSVQEIYDDDFSTIEDDAEIVPGSMSHEDVEMWLSPKNADGGLQSVAELNCRGTMSLEKNDKSVVPASWIDALHGANSSLPSPKQSLATRFSLGAASVASARKTEADSESEDTTSENGGGFPTFKAAGGSPGDCSHIGTVNEEMKSALSPSSARDTCQLSSKDSKSGNSLTNFITDLVWLEKKISDEKDATKVRETIELTLNESDLQASDSFSYQCDSFSPRSNSSEEEDATTISSRHTSQPMSIVCRDCYLPPGNFAIDIISTKDGPMVNRVQEKMEQHLSRGDLIIAVDNCDTRSMSAERVMAIMSSRSNLERKLTVLQFGGGTSEL
jgi:hypothetical protein